MGWCWRWREEEGSVGVGRRRVFKMGNMMKMLVSDQEERRVKELFRGGGQSTQVSI